MSSLKKWRETLHSVSDVPIYCVPGLFAYSWPMLESFAHAAGGRLAGLIGIGPCKMPSCVCVVVDGDIGLVISTKAVDGGEQVEIRSASSYGKSLSDATCIISAAPSGRVLAFAYRPESGWSENTSDAERAGFVGSSAGAALVFAQIFRRHRTRVECVRTGNARRGTASYRGDTYVIRGISNVLRQYRKLDGEESVRTGGRQRWHMKKGYYVHLNSDRERWVDPYEAGDERLGRIIKDYSLPEYQPRERESR